MVRPCTRSFARDGSLLIPLTKDQSDKVVKALNTDVLPLQFARLENIPPKAQVRSFV